MLLGGKVAIVTGASAGIGREVALEFARAGCSLAIAARRTSELETVAELCRTFGVRCIPISTNVTIRGDCEQLARRTIEELGPIDILVNNAGFGIFDPIERADVEDLHAMMETNYFGTVHCIQAVLPHMLTRKSGSIVNVASIAGIMGYARMGGYCATKFAIIGFTEALRDEVIGRGIRVSLVCPGTTETEFFQKAEKGKMPGASRLILAIPPARVARAVRLAAERGTYRTVVPSGAAAYMRLKEMFPRTAHMLMRRVSAVVERKRD